MAAPVVVAGRRGLRGPACAPAADGALLVLFTLLAAPAGDADQDLLDLPAAEARLAVDAERRVWFVRAGRGTPLGTAAVGRPTLLGVRLDLGWSQTLGSPPVAPCPAAADRRDRPRAARPLVVLHQWRACERDADPAEALARMAWDWRLT